MSIKNQIELKPLYFASVSGGKDSLYMLAHILHNLDKYPLDGVVHFELEIDYPWVKNVIDYMEFECNKFNIPFYRIAPSVSYWDLIDKYGFPNRRFRWCNFLYKMDADKVFKEWLKQNNYKPIYYIGFCADEEKRFKNDSNIYPLAELGIYESTILNWAKNQPLFNDFYKFNDRQGCLYCPNHSYKELAYISYYYPDLFNKMMDLCIDSEIKYKANIFQSNPKYNSVYVKNIVLSKYLPRLIEKV